MNTKTSYYRQPLTILIDNQPTMKTKITINGPPNHHGLKHNYDSITIQLQIKVKCFRKRVRCNCRKIKKYTRISEFTHNEGTICVCDKGRPVKATHPTTEPRFRGTNTLQHSFSTARVSSHTKYHSRFSFRKQLLSGQPCANFNQSSLWVVYVLVYHILLNLCTILLRWLGLALNIRRYTTIFRIKNNTSVAFNHLSQKNF